MVKLLRNGLTAVAKSEARMSKSETNPNARMMK
jgi:hypothetical protein